MNFLGEPILPSLTTLFHGIMKRKLSQFVFTLITAFTFALNSHKQQDTYFEPAIVKNLSNR